MRKLPILLSACVAVLASATVGARAQEAGEDFAKRLFAATSVDHKTFACFVRRYDARHLAQHSRQKVGAMKLLVTVERLPDDEELHYGFRLGVKFRKQPDAFETSGDCGHPVAEVAGQSLRIHCAVDCDGGSIETSLADGDKSVMVKLDEIRLFPAVDPARRGNDADDADPDHDGHVMFEAGADDHVFRLDRADITECQSLAVDAEELAALQRK
ncbi:MAG TPA: hypothetical protein VLX44_09340 [Xanthobacteraceae bacterium]|nr:hypothetical protein [Xanthobacteraceae bacterium]